MVSTLIEKRAEKLAERLAPLAEPLDKIAAALDRVQAARTAPVAPRIPPRIERGSIEDKLAQKWLREGQPRPSSNGHGEPLPKGARAILIATAQHGGADRSQLTILTGYKRSSRDDYISRLKARGYVETSGDRVQPTQTGMDALGGDFEPLPVGADLMTYWSDRLPFGERKVLEVVAADWPQYVDRGVIDEHAGYKRSSRDDYISRLKARKLVEVSRDGVKASDLLFG